MEALTQRVHSLALHKDEIVVIVGLDAARQHNFQAARVIDVSVSGDGRMAVQCLHGERSKLSVRRQNLLRAVHPEDRAALLTRVVWERQQELRVVRNFLLDRLRGEEGLALHIASFFPPRETMALTSGFSMGRVVREWSCAVVSDGRLQWRAIHGDHASAVFGAEYVPDGIARIDCAVVAIGSGRFLVAGGCNQHPSVAPKFFRSAFIYDALTHAVTPLADMPHARHGCGGACIDGKVYIVGGDYVCAPSMQADKALCAIYDLQAQVWHSLDAQFSEDVVAALSWEEGTEMVAFVPVGAVWGRLVVVMKGTHVHTNYVRSCHAMHDPESLSATCLELRPSRSVASDRRSGAIPLVSACTPHLRAPHRLQTVAPAHLSVSTSPGTPSSPQGLPMAACRYPHRVQPSIPPGGLAALRQVGGGSGYNACSSTRGQRAGADCRGHPNPPSPPSRWRHQPFNAPRPSAPPPSPVPSLPVTRLGSPPPLTTAALTPHCSGELRVGPISRGCRGSGTRP